MIVTLSLVKFLNLPWDTARGYLREDLDHLEAAFNQLAARVGQVGTGLPGPPGPPGPPGGGGVVASVGYWTPITNGDPLSPEILFDSAGDCIVGFVPTGP